MVVLNEVPGSESKNHIFHKRKQRWHKIKLTHALKKKAWIQLWVNSRTDYSNQLRRKTPNSHKLYLVKNSVASCSWQRKLVNIKRYLLILTIYPWTEERVRYEVTKLFPKMTKAKIWHKQLRQGY